MAVWTLDAALASPVVAARRGVEVEGHEVDRARLQQA